MDKNIYLCLAHMSEEGIEQKYVKEAFDTNWVVPLGPNVNAFEEDLKRFVGEGKEVVALSAGTAAVHLALLACGVGQGDEVIVQSFTFCASSHPVTYLGAVPVFVDSEKETWNMSPELLEEAIKDRIAKTGKKPKAIVPVALYGMPYDCTRIMEIADRYAIPVVEDAAEGFGSRFKGQFGVQWSPISNRRRILTIGATYDIGGDLNPNVTTKVQTGDIFNTVAMDMGNRLGLKLPQQVAVGIYYNTPKIAVGADYVYQDWRSGNSRLVEKSAAGFDVAYRNTNTVKLGVEYTPNKADLRSALKRWSYRAGVRYGTYNQTFGGVDVNEYAVTLGVGIPLTVLGGILGASSVDLGVEVGGRGSFKAINEQVSLVKQTYCKFSLGVTLFGDYWFVRPKYD